MTANASQAEQGAPASRFGRLFLGYVAASAAVSVTFVWPPLLLGLAYSRNWTLEHFALFAIGPTFLFLFVLLLALLPFLLWSVASERWSLQSKAAHILAGVSAGFPVWAVHVWSRLSSDGHILHPLREILLSLIWIGACASIGGYVYWYLSGRHAGSVPQRAKLARPAD
ncbi:hypothetical protein [Roseibium sediminicola]|uniref:Uncharacterized protein n=1 Tax=Roseibium sediminicola TaxID=2933272 RepID=A0ABT0GY56_9HYPH|nr:hypothetical protein [Roseibium sp. CAU 1639]MCK7614379.1 hypothetical protein [Roseibium sp. CAU 1639]